MLNLHMTTLTKADQVTNFVCLFYRTELSKWAFMMDTKAFPQMLPTRSAVTGLRLYNNRASSEPSSTSICLWASNPIRGIFTRAEVLSKFGSAWNRAEITCDAGLISPPSLPAKNRAAVLAREAVSLFPVWMILPVHVLLIKSVGGLVTDAVFVSKKPISGAVVSLSFLGLVLVQQYAAATTRAGFSLFKFIGRNLKSLAANFTGFFHSRHLKVESQIIPPFGGLMTVPYRAIKLGRKGRASELNTSYFFDGIQYLKTIEKEMSMPDMFAFEQEEAIA
jgi:hypothetical protein